ncbi:MAG: hypothetical protein OER86_00430 [Phycisphaerae bacterium]|nr:hypothetical protein [Phycisphaerae bacterium]
MPETPAIQPTPAAQAVKCKYCNMTGCTMPGHTGTEALTRASSDKPAVKCKYCNMIGCTMPGHSGTQALTRVPGDEPAIMTHAGIPTWMASGGIILIVLVTHILVSRRRGTPIQASYPRRRLLQSKFIKALVNRPFFPLLIQSVSIGLFLLVIVAGLIGSQRTNIGPVLTWTWWWVLLIFLILGFGKAFCAVCPWEGISAMVTSLSLRSRVKKLGWERKWPKWARNIYPALALFIILTWLELGLDITRSASMTAVLGLGFAAAAVLTALLFERRAFCRYLCFVGRIQGLYALFSPVELRPQSVDACRSCTGKECYNGSETATGCPTHLFPAALKENTYCTLCTECVRACPHDNLEINIRPLGTDLYRKIHFRWDEAVFAVVLLALTIFHGVTMTPAWTRLNDLLRVETGVGPKVAFTVLMAVTTILPVWIFWLTAAAARRLARTGDLSTGKIFKAFAYGVIPIALFYHLAHNGMHFFMEAQYLVPLLSDPFGWGWNLFGTAGKAYPPLLSLRSIWWIQILLVIVGHVYGVLVSDRICRSLFSDRRVAQRALVPLLACMILLSAVSVWLIAQPMEMRSGM